MSWGHTASGFRCYNEDGYCSRFVHAFFGNAIATECTAGMTATVDVKQAVGASTLYSRCAERPSTHRGVRPTLTRFASPERLVSYACVCMYANMNAVLI